MSVSRWEAFDFEGTTLKKDRLIVEHHVVPMSRRCYDELLALTLFDARRVIRSIDSGSRYFIPGSPTSQPELVTVMMKLKSDVMTFRSAKRQGVMAGSTREPSRGVGSSESFHWREN